MEKILLPITQGPEIGWHLSKWIFGLSGKTIILSVQFQPLHLYDLSNLRKMSGFRIS